VGLIKDRVAAFAGDTCVAAAMRRASAVAFFRLSNLIIIGLTFPMNSEVAIGR
jgi:hypothetical protein